MRYSCKNLSDYASEATTYASEATTHASEATTYASEESEWPPCSYSPSPFSNSTAYDSCTSVHSQFNNKPYDSVAEISTNN